MSAAIDITTAPIESAATPDPAPAAPVIAPPAGLIKPTPAPDPSVPRGTPPTVDVSTLPEFARGLTNNEYAQFVADKGYKSLDDAIKSAMLTERMKGVPADQIIKRPDWSKPESVAEFRKALGAPEAVTGYQNHEVALPIGTLDGDAIAQLSLKLGLPQELHSQLLDGAGELVSSLVQQNNEEMARRSAASMADLKKSWGTRYGENMQLVDSAIAQIGVTEGQWSALTAAFDEGPAREFMARIGTMIGEHKRPSEGATPAVVTSASAASEIKDLIQDKAFGARLRAGDVDAKRRWDELHKIAYGE